MANDDNRGQWQAQGNDMAQPQGLCHPWNHPNPPTKGAGLKGVDDLAEACEHRQRVLRDAAYEKARLHVRRAPPGGYSGFQLKSFPVKAPPIAAKKARVDLEITSGFAFVDDPVKGDARDD